MMKNIALLILTVFLTFYLKAQIPKGDRVLAWQVDMAENANYDSAFAYALSGCMESAHLFYTWSGIEPNLGEFDADYITNNMDIANIFFPAYGVKLELQLAPLNTVAKEVPSELMGVAFDDPLMINQFKSMLDTMFHHIPDIELSALNIGNESDVILGTDPGQYEAFKTFLDSVATHAKELYFELHGEELKVGTTFTFDGLVDEVKSSLCESVNESRDIITVTYYPLNSDFTMESPSVVETDFTELIEIYNDESKPIYFAECGYSSSPVCNSSEEMQAEFFQNVFAAWDTYYDNIKHLTIFKTNDWSQAEVDIFGDYYGISDEIFLEYLRALGVRTWPGDGENKIAYEMILCELNARDWCPTNCLIDDVAESIESEIFIYPNPSSDYFHIEMSNLISVEIYNQMGQLVLISDSGLIHIEQLTSGIYQLVAISEGDGKVHRRVVVY